MNGLVDVYFAVSLRIKRDPTHTGATRGDGRGVRTHGEPALVSARPARREETRPSARGGRVGKHPIYNDTRMRK